MISFNFALTEEDYKNYYVYMLWLMPNKKREIVMNSLKYLIPTVFFIVIFNYLLNNYFFNSTIVIVIIYLTCIQIYSLLYMEAALRKQANKVAYNPMNNIFFLTNNYTFDAECFIVKTTLHETTYKYSVVIKKIETDLYYFLFMSSEQALIIPKRVFMSALERQEFERMLSQNLDKKVID